jgi:hypothetical protein
MPINRPLIAILNTPTNQNTQKSILTFVKQNIKTPFAFPPVQY